MFACVFSLPAFLHVTLIPFSLFSVPGLVLKPKTSYTSTFQTQNLRRITFSELFQVFKTLSSFLKFSRLQGKDEGSLHSFYLRLCPLQRYFPSQFMNSRVTSYLPWILETRNALRIQGKSLLVSTKT